MSRRRRFLTRASAAAPALTTVGPAPARAASPVRGIFNWIHGTGNAERAFAFYHDVFGIELARSPFAGGAQAAAPPEPVRRAAQAGSDPLVWDLTNSAARDSAPSSSASPIVASAQSPNAGQSARPGWLERRIERWSASI